MAEGEAETSGTASQIAPEIAPRNPPQIPTGDPWSQRLASDEDVVNAYRLLFAREPESVEAVTAKRGMTRAELLHQLISSEEFAVRVIEPVEDGRPLTGLMFDSPMPRDLPSWAAEFMPLGEPGRAALVASRTWYEALAALLGDVRFAPTLRAAAPAAAEPAFLDRLRAPIAGLAGRLVLGGVEEVRASRVRGWALDRADPETPVTVQLYADGVFVAAAAADRFRRELQALHGGEGRFGFELEGFTPPEPNSERAVALEVREAASQLVLGHGVVTWRSRKDGVELAGLHEQLALARAALERIERAINVVGGGFGFTLERYDEYRRVHYARSPADTRAETVEARGFAWRPRVSAWLRVDEAAFDLDPLLESLAAQSYPEWSLTLQADTAARDAQATGSAAIWRARVGDRLRVVAAGAEPLDPESDLVVLLDASVRLAPDALFQLARAAQATPRPAMIYADEDRATRLGGARGHADPVFRTAFDYDLALQEDATGSLVAFEQPLLATLLEAGGRLEPAHRRDLVLRAAERLGAGGIAHVARVLAHRVGEAAPVTEETAAETTRAHLRRIGAEAEVEPFADVMGARRRGAVRVRWPLAAEMRAAVIIPTRDRLDLLGPCLASLLAMQSDNRVPLEIVVVDNASRSASTLALLRSLRLAGRVRLLSWYAPFNWSAINNYAAGEVDAEVLIFLNNDTLALSRDWSDELCRQAMRPEVGAVGARLLYEDGTIQHAGMVAGGVNSLVAHEAAGAPGDDPGYLGRNVLVRNVSAVTGACLATRAQVFRDLGGFDAEGFSIEANDVDYCLRVRRAGLAVLYDPQCTLHHFESKSRGHTNADEAKRAHADRELERLQLRWGPQLADDPFYNRHFDRYSRPLSRLQAPDATS